MLVNPDKWARLDREDLRDRPENLEKMVKQENQETPEKEASLDHLDLEVFLAPLDLQDSRDTEATEDSLDRRGRPVQLGQRERQVPLVRWELLGQWVLLGCQERGVDPDLAESRENVVLQETWANLGRWVHWE